MTGSTSSSAAGTARPGVADGAGGRRATPDVVQGTGRPGRTLALTFDDGPHPRTTPALLDVLRRHGVRAVFCLWGDHVRAHPEIVRRVVAEGHVLGNHSMHHDDLSGWSDERVGDDLRETAAAIEAAVPGADVPWFRAPFGAWGRSPGVAAALGMQPLGWSLEVEDWDPPPPAEVLLRRLEEGVTPGGVVLLHDGGGDRSATVAAVERLVPRLLADGWELTVPSREPVPSGGSVPSPEPVASGGPVPGMAGTLRTERLVLTALTVADLDAIQPIFGAPGRLMGDGESTPEQTRDWLARRELRRREAGLCWYGLRRASEPEGPLLGDAGLFLGRTGDEPEIGLEVAPEHRGLGLATEAARAVVAAGHAVAPRIWATVRTWNTASLTVLARAGFVTDRVERDDRGELVYLHHTA